MSRTEPGTRAAPRPRLPTAPDGLIVIDKPSGWTSHDVVARMRRLAGTRKVGHAGTLDPMATGVLIVGIGRATRLLGLLAAHDKDYLAGIKLGVVTSTDDAEGEVLATFTTPMPGEEQLVAAMAALTGVISQVPPAYSAISVDGQRSYARARAGETVELAARSVTVSRFALVAAGGGAGRAVDGAVDGSVVDAEVTCSSGTYVRALARDLGTALGTGGHLCRLRRTRVGGFTLAGAHPLEALSDAVEGGLALPVVALAEAVATAFSRRDLSIAEATDVRHGRRLGPSGQAGPVGAFGPDGSVLALLRDVDGAEPGAPACAQPTVVFAPA